METILGSKQVNLIEVRVGWYIKLHVNHLTCFVNIEVLSLNTGLVKRVLIALLALLRFHSKFTL